MAELERKRPRYGVRWGEFTITKAQLDASKPGPDQRAQAARSDRSHLSDGCPSAVASTPGIKPRREPLVIRCQGDWED